MRLYGFAKLSDDELRRVQEFERDTGKRLLVYRPFDAEPAELTAKQMERLEQLERDLGDVIIAVK